MKRYLIFSGLLSVICFLVPGCKSEPVVPETKKEVTLFTLLNPAQTNVHFENTLTEALNTNILMYEYFYNGGGVAAADFNNDGKDDLYFTSNMSENKLYLNKGNMVFEDITAIAGAGGRPGPWKTGVNAVDINADGKLDIYLCYSGALPLAKRSNQLFINTGNDQNGIPIFNEMSEAYGLASPGFSNQSYFFDYDQDGDLDMLLMNHNPKNLPLLNEEATAALLKQDNREKGLRLFKQDKGRFEDITSGSGINGSELSYGLGIGISDFNADGWSDFYVSNDYSVPDYLYINNRNGTFTNQLQASLGHISQFSMGNDVADFNNDLLPDIYTLDMLPEDNHRQKLLLSPDNFAKFDLNLRSGFYYQYMRNMLHQNNGNGTFSEIGQLAGISNTDWSWSALFGDYDNDGWKDLHVTNGYLRDYTNLDFINYMNDYVEQKGRLQREDVMEIIRNMPSSSVVNYIFRNNKGSSFSNTVDEWGIRYNSNSNGAAYADLDNDGDLDLVVNNINQPAFVFQNNSQKMNGHHYLKVQLDGINANTRGIGARVEIFHNGSAQVQEQNPARGYLSAVSYTLHFGLGNSAAIDSLHIVWNSGGMQSVYNIKPNQVLVLHEKDAKKDRRTIAPAKPWFREIKSEISFEPAAAVNNDFNRQPLLISQFSHDNLCIRSFDINNDQLNDILIGGPGNQAAHLYIQQKNKTFRLQPISAFETDKAFHDTDIEMIDANADGKTDIYIASGGYHDMNPDDALLQDRLYLNDGHNNFVRSNGLPKMKGSTSRARSQDINGDGFADIFVGKRVVPGRYPETPGNHMLINDGKGNFSDKTNEICPALATCGMVTDAAWIDLDLDKKNELLVVGEWIPPLVYRIDNAKLVDVSRQYFDKDYRGWWNSIAAGDFNGDQKPDLVLGNMGINTQFAATEKEPLELYYKDFDNNGSVDPLFSFYIQHVRYPYLTRDELLSQLPAFRARFSKFKDYADITTDKLFNGSELEQAGHLVANHMQTTLFLSTPDGKFVMEALPEQAQYSPVYAILPYDFNKDGKLDLLLYGNNSHTRIRLGKFDANYGTLLKGDGVGNFQFVQQGESGFNVRGDIRSAILVNETIYLGICNRPLTAYKLVHSGK